MRIVASILPSGKRLLRNICLDLKYGAFLGGTRTTRYAELGVEDTSSTDYSVLPFIFTKDTIKEFDVLVDIGCGKGRVLNWWLDQGLSNQIFGMELDETIAQKTRRRLRRYKNIKVISGDALDHLPENGTIFYLYNPFKKPWVARLKRQLELLFSNKKSVTVFYYNCVYIDVFKSDPNWMVREVLLDQRFHMLAIIRMQQKNSSQGAGPAGGSRLDVDDFGASEG